MTAGVRKYHAWQRGGSFELGDSRVSWCNVTVAWRYARAIGIDIDVSRTQLDGVVVYLPDTRRR